MASMASESRLSVNRGKSSGILENANPYEQLRKKASQRVLDRIDFGQSRHKPISLLKQEVKRTLEQFFDTEAVQLARNERDRAIEEILSDLLGFGPLDELFRDEKVVEFMILSHDQIISRDREFWLPVNTRFRDREQYRAMIEKIRSQAESIFVSDSNKTNTPAAFDVKLSNGFRMVGVCPPSVLQQPPVVVFTRTNPAAKSAVAQSNSTVVPPSAGVRTPPRVVQTTPTGIPTPAPRATPDKSTSSSIDFNTTAKLSGSTSGSVTVRVVDPFERYRIRITERLILRLASAGVYDLSALPLNELRRAIAMYVQEYNGEENLGLTSSEEDRLTLEILASMNRK
jgi:pilus assembly protein CpaF